MDPQKPTPPLTEQISIWQLIEVYANLADISNRTPGLTNILTALEIPILHFVSNFTPDNQQKAN